ncbi:MAG: hypothetical protein AMXMBFR56_82510 [Polyangiaceae bacterium]
MAVPQLPDGTVRMEAVPDPLVPKDYFSDGAVRLPTACSSSGCSWFRPERLATSLSLLDEPAVLVSERGYTAVRVLYEFDLPTYPRAAVRISRHGDSVTLVAKAAETLATDQGRLMWKRTRSLTVADWKRVESGVAALWIAPTVSEHEVETRKSVKGMHGQCLLVEVVRAGEQRVWYDCPRYGGTRTAALVKSVEDLARCE